MGMAEDKNSNNSLLSQKWKSMLGVLLALIFFPLAAWLIFGAFQNQDKSLMPTGSQTELKVVLRASGPGGPVTVHKISCPSQGTAGCQDLQALSQQDFYVAEDKICAAVYGGPSQATVSGVLNGKPLLAVLNMHDACQIALWNQLAKPLDLPLSKSSSLLPQ